MVGVYKRSQLKFQFLLLVFGASGLLAPSFSAADSQGPWKNEVIHLGFIPGEGAADLKLKGEELAKMVLKKTGIEVRPYIGTSYSDLIEKIAQKKVDIAFLSALSYVEAESQVGLKVLLKKVWEKEGRCRRGEKPFSKGFFPLLLQTNGRVKIARRARP